MSIWWVLYKHPFYTHTETYLRELSEAAREVEISSKLIEEYKRRLPNYGPRKKLENSGIPFPPFHLTTEEKRITSNKKRFTTKVLAIYTSVSAAQLMIEVMTKLDAKGKMGFILSTFQKKYGPDAKLKLPQKHKAEVRDTTCLAVYNISESVLKNFSKDTNGKQYTLEEYISVSMNLKSIERTNTTSTEE